MIGDCEILTEYCWNSIIRTRKFNVVDNAIISLWDSIVEKAKAVQILCDNKQYSEVQIIIRSFIEQFVYIQFILKENTSKRAKAFLYHQRYTDTLNVKKAIDAGLPDLSSENFKDKIDKKVQASPAHRKDLESELDYFKEKYFSYLPKNVKKNNIEKWYSFEKLNKYNNLRDLMKDLGDEDIYWLYKMNSNNVHGTNTPRNIHLENVNVEEGMADVNLSYSISETDIYFMESILKTIFMDLAKYYNLMRNRKIKGIITKMQINIMLRNK